MDKFLKRPKAQQPTDQEGKYEKFNLQENPFPSSPFVNPNSTDAKYNGEIYEPSIRKSEYTFILQNFLTVPQNDSNHLRLGYILDTSYIGRGNGKSAFLVNLQREINKDYCLTLSNGHNKCFALTLVPEPGGKTKTFEGFVELFVDGIFRSNVIDDSLATLRLEALLETKSDFDIAHYFENESQIRDKLTSEKWYREEGISYREINAQVNTNKHLQSLPSDFPIFSGGPLLSHVTSKKDFIEYYSDLKRGKPRFEFLFSHLVHLFLAAAFNGAYIFIDDFERIPDFQSERQKRDFALELRNCQFDGLSTNARLGFYVMVFVLHAGVPRLIENAWSQSGLEHRAPFFFKTGVPKNVIRFEKITLEDTYSLIQKYMNEYRITPESSNPFSPFTKEAVAKTAELSEFNASKILKMAYELLERAVEQGVDNIDIDYVLSQGDLSSLEQKPMGGIHDAPTRNLLDENVNE